LNSKLDADTYYTDATVAGDTTYYYATTAVNSSGKESSYSNQAKVVVP
jgi:fibronectin type 3 domain-containing protein